MGILLKTDGIVYRVCSWVYNFILLNILYIFSCILIVTAFPATAALFGVARQWVKGKDVNVFKQYKELFKENLKQSVWIGFLIALVCLFLTADFYTLTLIHTTLKPLLFICLLIVSFIVWTALSSVYPLMVNGFYSNKELIANAFKLSFFQPHITIVQTILSLAWVYLSIRFGVLIVIISFSGFAFFNYWLVNLKFKKLTAHELSVSQRT
jgi:uncharacterized membrane protein YesL